MTENFELYGNAGLYVADGNTFSFQVGEGEQLFAPAAIGTPEGAELPYNDKVWLGVNGYQVCARGRNNALCEDVAREIKRNRILPRLYRKQAKMLYGHGPMPYRNVMHEGKLRREYVEEPEVQAWFNSWQAKGLPSVQEFCKACIINYYYFGDFFVKWRMARGHRLGRGRARGDGEHPMPAGNHTARPGARADNLRRPAPRDRGSMVIRNRLV